MPPEAESTATERPADDDIRTQLSAAFDESVNEDNADVTDEVEKTEPDTDATQEADKTETPDQNTDEAEAQAISQELLEAPQHWSKEHRELFGKLGTLEGGKEYQEFLLNRHKEMEADYTRKTMDIADVRREAQTWQPVRQIFQNFPNLNPVQTIQTWAQIAMALEQNPTQALQHLAQQYRVDLSELNQQQEGFIDPRYQQLESQFNQLQSYLMQQSQQEDQSRIQGITNQIQEFANQKTETGDPAHPYFDELFQDILGLAHAERALGRVPNLQQLYDKATRINPDVSAKIQADQRKAAEKKAQQEAMAKAAKARQAAKVQSGDSSGSASFSEDTSLRDMIASQL